MLTCSRALRARLSYSDVAWSWNLCQVSLHKNPAPVAACETRLTNVAFCGLIPIMQDQSRHTMAAVVLVQAPRRTFGCCC